MLHIQVEITYDVLLLQSILYCRINVSLGCAATESITSDLLNGYSRGEECLEEFISHHLKSSTKNFYDPIKKLNLGTFSYLAVKSLSALKLENR